MSRPSATPLPPLFLVEHSAKRNLRHPVRVIPSKCSDEESLLNCHLTHRPSAVAFNAISEKQRWGFLGQTKYPAPAGYS